MHILNKVCTLLLVAVFGLAGVMKLTPFISPEIHSQMVSDRAGSSGSLVMLVISTVHVALAAAWLSAVCWVTI